MITVSLTETDAFTILRGVLTLLLPPATPVLLGQVNRVPQTKQTDFVVYWPIRRERIETNVDDETDVFFTGAIAGPVMTVTDVSYGLPVLGGPVFGLDVVDGTTITGFTAVNPDGTGTYTVSPSQNVVSQSLAGGVYLATQNTKMVVQLDVHGPNSADNAQIISTLLRDSYGVGLFDPDNSGVSPLYTDDPIQLPYSNEQQQVENRWVVMTHLQINPTVTVPQQFADVLSVTLINVDATYPS